MSGLAKRMTAPASDAIVKEEQDRPAIGPSRSISCRSFWCVALLACLARLGAFAATDVPLEISYPPDSVEYDRLGRNLADRGVYSLAEGPPWTPDQTRTPVFPLFVATCYRVVGHAPTVVVAIQMAIALVTCMIVYDLGEQLCGPLAAAAGGVLFALDPLSIRYTSLLLSETFFTFLFTGSLLSLVAYLRKPGTGAALAAALLTGLAVLCRPIAVLWPLIPLALFALTAWRDRCWRPLVHGLLFSTVALSLVVPWMLRNQRIGGRAVLSTVQGINLYYQRAARVVADDENISLPAAQAGLRDRLQEVVKRERLDPSQENTLMEMWGREIVQASPLTYLRVHARGVCRMLLPDDRPLFGLSGSAVRWLDGAFLAVTYGMALVGLICGLLHPGRSAFLLVGAVLIYFAVMSGPEAYTRFRVPAMPALALLAGTGLAVVVGRDSKGGEVGN